MKKITSVEKGFKSSLIFALLLFLLVFILCLSIGSDSSVRLPSIKMIKDSMSGIWHYQTIIVLKIRLPRLLLAIISGGCLAVSGLIFQNILQNPLADPYLIGVSGGCALSAVIIQAAGYHNPIYTAVGAMIGGLVSMIFVQFIASRTGKINRGILILSGVVMNAFFSAIISVILIFSGSDMPRIFAWLLGSLDMPDSALLLPAFIVMFLCVIPLWMLSHQLDIISLGDFHSFHFGQNPERLKVFSVIIASILTSVAVSVSGMIGFVGMFVPHAMRFLFGFKHNILVPVSFIVGGMVLMIADTFVRSVPTGTELPVGAITALFGGPFFLLLLINKFRNSKI